MHLCWGCLHPFTEPTVQQLDIPDQLHGAFEALRMHLASLNDAKSLSTGHRFNTLTAQIQASLVQLMKRVEHEFTEQSSTIARLKAEREVLFNAEYLNSANEKSVAAEMPKRQGHGAKGQHKSHLRLVSARGLNDNPAPGRIARTDETRADSAAAHPKSEEKGTPRQAQSASTCGGAGGTGLLPDWPVSLSRPASAYVSKVRSVSPDLRPLTNRFGKEVYHPDRPQTAAPMANSGSVTTTLMTSLFLVTESVVTQLFAERGILWCRCQGSSVTESGDELVACVTIGPTKAGPPMRKSTTDGVVGATVCTGIAINIGTDHQDEVHAEPDAEARDAAETAVPAGRLDAAAPAAAKSLKPAPRDVECNMLLVPVYLQYKAFARVSVGVLQLINKTGAAAGASFSESDEVVALGAANILSHILSSYKGILTPGLKKAFVPSFIASKTTPLSGRVKDDDRSGRLPNCILSHTPPMLIHRTGDVGFVAKAELLKTQREVTVHGRVKELNRFQSTLDVAWKQTVASLADAEGKKVYFFAYSSFR
ncbi:hypothetical protein DIPPA_21405 [Diplonema papillatum]|nr:hypothetical protein DIPPA_21405 [Diplonema papillatum]